MESLEQKLTSLKLGRMRAVYVEWIERATQTGMDYGDFSRIRILRSVTRPNGGLLRVNAFAARLATGLPAHYLLALVGSWNWGWSLKVL